MSVNFWFVPIVCFAACVWSCEDAPFPRHQSLARHCNDPGQYSGRLHDSVSTMPSANQFDFDWPRALSICRGPTDGAPMARHQKEQSSWKVTAYYFVASTRQLRV